jgi:hypothetical protein
VSRSCSHDFSFASCCYYSAPRFLRFHGSSRALTPTPPTRHTHEARATRSSAAVATGTDGEAGAADGVRPPSVRPARGSRGPAALRVRAESGLGQGLRGGGGCSSAMPPSRRGTRRKPVRGDQHGRCTAPPRLEATRAVGASRPAAPTQRPEVRLGLARTRGIWRWVLGLVATSERASTLLTLSLGLGRQLLRTTSLC